MMKLTLVIFTVFLFAAFVFSLPQSIAFVTGVVDGVGATVGTLF